MTKTQYSINKVRKRLFALISAITFIFLIIIARMFTVQVVSGKRLTQKAIDQWTRELPVKAKRGNIYDCNGVVLAQSQGTYAVYIRTRLVKNKSRVAEVLSDILQVDEKQLLEKMDKKISEITVKRQVNREILNKISDYNLDGVYFSVDNSRYYPYNEALCQIIGYTSSDGYGQSGLEAYYDKYLRGVDGEIIYESDLTGKDISGTKPTYVKAQDGMDLYLTIDNDVQQICEGVMSEAMEIYTPKSASVIVADCESGAIKGICTMPSYNLNEIPRDDLEKLNKYGRSTLIVDSYEPGSTFKVITSTANIEEYFKGNPAAFSLNHIFSSNRYRYVGGRKIKCWSNHANGKHANENLAMALNNSCNPIFVDIALSLGKNTFYNYLDDFNFGKVTGIDFYGEAQGMLIPESAVTDGDLARIGFGQTIAVTPIQLLCAVNTCISGGDYKVPYLLNEIKDKNGKTELKFSPKIKKDVVSDKTSKIIAEYLEGVVKNGSGKQCYIEGYKVGGKTGTAQKYVGGVIAQGKYVMSFIGFFPADKPKYIALVIVDEPIGGQYGSTVAAPLCKEIFQKITECKNIKPTEVK